MSKKNSYQLRQIISTVVLVACLLFVVMSKSLGQVTTEPSKSIKYATKTSFVKFLGNVKIDSSLLVPSRPVTDTMTGVYRIAGSIFYNNTDNKLMYYDGQHFSIVGSGLADVWTMKGNTIGTGTDTSLGTIDRRGFVIMQDNTARLIITQEGKVGIKNTTPVYDLDVNGSFQAKSGRFARVTSATAPAQASDARFKKDIKQLENPMDIISKINGVSYYMQTDKFPNREFSAVKQYGVLAQDIEKVLPEIVSTDEDGYKSVAYTELIPYLIEAIKQQSAEIKSLKQQIEKK